MRIAAVIVIGALVATVPAAAVPAAAAEIEAVSTVDAVTVYPDGAAVTRVIRVALPAGETALVARDFPLNLDPASLRVEGESGRAVVIGSVEARPPKPVPPVVAPEIERRLEALRDNRDTLNDTIAALTARKDFAARFGRDASLGPGELGDARPLADWRAAFTMVGEEIAAADTAIRETARQRRDLDGEISRLEAQVRATPPRKMEVRIDLSAEAPTEGLLRVTYAVRGARWVPLYDARLDTGARDRKPALELVRRAEIVQQTGEDWTDVALSVSTVRTAKGGNAPDLRTLLVRYYEPPQPSARAPSASFQALAPMRADRLAKSADAPEPAPVEEREAAAEVGGFQVVFRVPGRISVPAAEGAKSFRIAGQTIAPDLLVRTAPALDATAFLEANFKHAEEAPLLPGRVALYRDGILVGRGELALATKEEPVRLGFGADDQVKVSRVVQRKTEGTSGLLSSSRTDTREFLITVRNGHATAIRMVVEDQLPVSENADIQVEMLPATTQPLQRDVRDRRGVLAWSFDLNPADAREIKLGWRIRWPADKTLAIEPQRP